ncbi:type VI secretion system-associated protein TagF [Crenobacter sp. SG2303]|uniref:Type VI secretion system-associated protein TagF n=1 Tax=Crenobacter oryzisoli TaxID=3056844 RepID=A0ABT7XKN3_9NEIS|nr:MULTISPECIES: type VI secretion system-associated protein TagF [unclassified Crenobacter]MDN0074139.1 type VI secretion system-associated protein TagF [Crenobacter sp. SG2303]MDN0083407.1 type VI secretion system-associated protein TagF [Crenobacter sp. SG2305]
MSFNFRRPQENPVPFCIFGKLPLRGDFVRINATHPAALEIDGLIADSLRQMEQQPDWPVRYQQMPASTFVLRTRDQRWQFLGAMQPSHDQSGRHYPLVAGFLLSAEVASAPLAAAMLANELFFGGLKEQLSSAIANSVEMLACRQFLEEQASFGGRSQADLELAHQLLEKHMARTPARVLDDALHASGRGDLESLLLAFTFHRQLLRRYAGSLPPQVYLLPLPEGDGDGMLAAVTWLSLYHAATAEQGESVEQCLIVMHPEGRFLALLPGLFTEQIASLCWGRQIDPRYVVDVAEPSAPWRNHQSYAEAAYVLGRRLNDPSLSVAELRDVVRSLSGSIG